MRKLTRGNSTPELRVKQRALVKAATKAWIDLLPAGKHYKTSELSAILSKTNYLVPLNHLSALADELSAEGYCQKGTERFKTAKGFWAYPWHWQHCVPNGPLAEAVKDESLFDELTQDDYPCLPVLKPRKKKSVVEQIAERKANRE